MPDATATRFETTAAVDDSARPFWQRQATWLEIAKIVLPLVLCLFAWGYTQQAKNDRQDLLIQQMAASQGEMTKALQELGRTSSQQGERLSSMEGKMDFLIENARNRQ